jgi:hypothetical protein
MSNNTDKFWVQTYGNVIRYIRERDAGIVQEISGTDSLITFSVTHTLDPLIYNFPLTLKRVLPADWLKFTASQNGKLLTTKTITENGKSFIILDVLPNGGDVLLRNTGTIAGIAEKSLVTAFTVYPNPFRSVSKIEFTLEKASVVSLQLLDESGKKIRNIASGAYSEGAHELLLDTSGLTGTVFYCALYVNDSLFSKKLISIK